jgi:hypothetical protein
MSGNSSVRPSAGLVDINLASEMLNPLEVLGAGAPDQAHPEQRCTRVREYARTKTNAECTAEPRAAHSENRRTGEPGKRSVAEPRARAENKNARRYEDTNVSMRNKACSLTLPCLDARDPLF